MKIPKIVFRPMTLKENIDVIKWGYFVDISSLDVRKYVQEYFPQLLKIDDTFSKEDIFSKIEEAVTEDYNTHSKRMSEEAERYNKIWEPINDLYISKISEYLNIFWPDNIDVIDANVGMTPVSPYNLDSFSFFIPTGIDEKELIRTAVHESLHFLWFEKWKQLFPDCPRREYNPPCLPWQYSEMVVDPIMNSDEIKNILHVQEKAYDNFYDLEFNGEKVMSKLINIYNKPISIDEKIKEGYEYISKAFNNFDSKGK